MPYRGANREEMFEQLRGEPLCNVCKVGLDKHAEDDVRLCFEKLKSQTVENQLRNQLLDKSIQISGLQEANTKQALLITKQLRTLDEIRRLIAAHTEQFDFVKRIFPTLDDHWRFVREVKVAINWLLIKDQYR
jgi:hypothetical protein